MKKDINYSIFKSSEVKDGERIIKVDEFGLKTADESAPFGIDSQPLKNMIAIYANTSNDSDKVILGYINKHQLSKIKEGENRIFSLKEDGSLSTEIYLKNDGKIELNGKEDNAVRYLALNNALQEQNAALNQELTKIVASISALGGSYAYAQISLDISLSKIEDLQTS